MTRTTPTPAVLTPYERLTGQLARLDRGRLAQLRRSLGDDLPGQSVPWLEGMFQRSGLSVKAERQWRVLALVAGLYALVERPDDAGVPGAGVPNTGVPDAKAPASMPERRESFGKTFGALYLSQDQRPSTEKRFLALLDADMDALPYALRQAVTLLKADRRKPDWVQLITDVGFWEHETIGEEVRRRWAKDFYRSAERIGSPDTAPAPEDSFPASPTQLLPKPLTLTDEEGDDTL